VEPFKRYHESNVIKKLGGEAPGGRMHKRKNVIRGNNLGEGKTGRGNLRGRV